MRREGAGRGDWSRAANGRYGRLRGEAARGLDPAPSSESHFSGWFLVPDSSLGSRPLALSPPLAPPRVRCALPVCLGRALSLGMYLWVPAHVTAPQTGQETTG